MLGIRRYQGVAVDLFQGEISRFAVDQVVAPFAADLAVADFTPARHVGVDTSLAGGSDAAQVLHQVKAFLDSDRQTRAVHRITLVTPLASFYQELQDQLFSLFPDEAGV